MHDVAGGRPGGLGGEHRSLSPARELSPSTPPDPPLPLSTLSLFLSFSALLPSSRPFRSSLATILYFTVPLLPPPSSSPTRRVLLFPLFSSRVLFFTVLLALSLFLSESCDRTQPNNHHRRLKPENSAASPLPFSHSTCRSFLSISSQRLSIILFYKTRILLSNVGVRSIFKYASTSK